MVDPRCAASNVLRMFAYLDAGTGSMLMAAFAGGAAGIGVLLRLYGHRILGVFSKKHRPRPRRPSAT